MVTAEHISIFQKYGQDGDMLSRIGRPAEKRLFSSGQWQAIDLGIHLLRNERAGLGGPELHERVEQFRREQIADQAAWTALVELL